MPILDSELLWYKAASVDDDTPASNGGRIDFSANSPSGSANNLFPNVTRAQRLAGVVQWRKAAIGVRNADNLELIDPQVSIESGTPGDSWVLLYAGTHEDTENEVTGRPYGYATLASDAALAATSISVTTEADWSALDAADRPFQVGDTIRIDARDTIEDVGNAEYRVIDTVSYTGTALTIGLTAGLDHAFATGVHVASVYQPGNISAGYSALSVSNEIGSTLAYDPTGDNLIAPSIGSIRQTWTVTITDGATGALSLSGDTLGAVATGATGALLAPDNPAGGKYLRLSSAGWSGTAVTGDTLVFTTSPAAIPLWYKRTVPAGADSIASDPVDVCIEAESA